MIALVLGICVANFVILVVVLSGQRSLNLTLKGLGKASGRQVMKSLRQAGRDEIQSLRSQK